MMFVEQLRGLEDIEGKSFKRYFYLLENLACVKTFILCMELDAPDIILSLFRTFFQVCPPLFFIDKYNFVNLKCAS